MNGSDLSTARSKTVTWEDPSISAAAMAAMPGRELLQAIIDGRLPRPPIAELFGGQLVSIGEGRARFEVDSGTIEAEGRVLRVGRQVAFAEARARTAGGKLVGHATTSLALMRE